MHRSDSSGIYFVLGHAAALTLHRSTSFGRDIRLWDGALNWSNDERRARDPVGYAMYSEFQPQMFNSNPPDHRRMRSLFQHAFTPRNVARMEGLVRREVDRLLAAMPAEGSADFMSSFAGPLPVRVISAVFDVPEADAHRMVAWSDAISHVLELSIRRAQKQTALDALRDFKGWLRSFVADRRARPGDGLVDHVIAAEGVEGGLAEDELLTNLVAMLVAGHETTTHLLGNGLLALLRHPDQLAALRASPAGVPTAVEELLRYEPSANLNARVAIEDAELDGVPIARGSMLVAMIAAVNRDPAVFDAPDGLDLTRDPNPHQTFGGGMHHCIGAPLARLEGRVALEALLARYGRIALDGEPAWLDRTNLRGLASLPIRVGA